MRRGVFRAALLVSSVGVGTGCATEPYEFRRPYEEPGTLLLAADEPQVERGRRHRFLDGLGHYLLSLPSKILLIDWRVDNHDVSPETEAALLRYLHANGLHDVKVRINQYAPGPEWRRLFRNRAVAPFWRYTVGILSVAGYTAFPGRAFGGDSYNPYTNTISLYSDVRAVALHEGGHAKDFADTETKGFYGALRLLPLVALWQEAVATSDALGYERAQGTGDDERGALHTLYPAYGTYVGGEAAQWVGGGSLYYIVQYGAVVVGHIVGRTRGAFVDDREAPPPVVPPERPDRPAPPDVSDERLEIR